MVPSNCTWIIEILKRFPPLRSRSVKKLSFTVTRVNRYFDKTQIVGIGTMEAEDGTKSADMELVSDNASIYVWEPDRALTISDIHRVVRITGTPRWYWRRLWCG